MGKARNRAERTGDMDVIIGTTKLVPDASGDLEVKDANNARKKIIASEIKLGSGNDVVIIKRDASTGKAQFQTSSDGGSSTTNQSVGGATTVTNPSDLPITGNEAGDLKLVTSTNNLMIYNGSGWYKIATITNATPTISSAGNASYAFATNGTPVTIEIVASDPEGIALQYKYQVTTGSLGSTATVTNSATSGGTYSALAANTLSNNRFFKVTPSTSDAHAGTFAITFSVTDGINTANSSASSFTLAFDVSGSYEFDGTGDYIDTTNPLSGTGDFTMEGWVYPTASGTYDGYFTTCQASGANGGIVVAKDKFFVTHGGGSSQIGFSTIENGVWYHIALQRISNVFSLYLNGVLQGTATATVSLTGSTLRLGSRYVDNTTHTFEGYMSNFRIVDGSTVYTPITTGAGLDFGSSNNTITSTASHSGFDFGTNDFTIEFFYKWSTNSGYQTPLDHQYNLTDAITIQSNTNTYKWGVFGSGLSLVYESSDATANVWHHYAVVRNGNTVKMYRDGVQTLSQSHTGTIGGVDPTYFGGAQPQSAHYDKGKISNFRVVKGTALYTGTFTPPTAPLTAISGTSLLLFQESSGSTLSDGSSNNVTITKGSGHTILTNDGPTYGGITTPTTPLTAVTNTELLTLTESEPNNITNGSYYFASTSNHHLRSGTSSDFTLGTNNDYTVEFWYKFPSSISASGYLFDMGANTFVIQMFSSNTKIGTWGTGGTIIQGNSNVGVSIGVWHHIVAQRSVNVHTLYINGQLQSSKTDSGNVHNFTGTSITLNNYGGNGNYGQQVYLSDFRFVKGTVVYSGNFTPPSGPLTKTGGTYPSNTNVNTSIPSGHTKLLTAQNSSGSYVDNSDSNHTLTASGTVTPSAGIQGAPTDLSSSSYSASYGGNTTHSYITPFTQGAGGSVLFDGTGDYLSTSTSSNLVIGTNDFTLEYWIYSTSLSGTKMLLDRRVGSNSDMTMNIDGNGGGKIRFYDGSGYRIITASGINTNTWYHVALVRSSGTTKLYINGVAESTTYSDSVNYQGNGIHIGDGPTIQSPFEGYMSNFRMVIGTAVYTTNFTAPTSKLTAVTNTKLLTCNDSNTINDESTLSSAITVNGDAVATRFNPF